MPTTSLLRKLSLFADLNADEIAVLVGEARDIRTTKAPHTIISDGERPEHLHLITEGWAARYKILKDGSRQITAFLLPGDFCDVHATILQHMEQGVVALTTCKIALIASDRLDRLTAQHVGLTRALWWSALLDEAIVRNWVVNNGRRQAYERIAWLLCELHERMQMIGLVDDGRLALSLTQEDLADATGLTPVHINRTLNRLRADGLIELHDRVLKIQSVAELKQVAGFDPSYLHVVRRAH